MADSIASLGLVVDSSGLQEASRNMHVMSDAALKAQNSARMFSVGMAEVQRSTTMAGKAEEQFNNTTQRTTGLLASTLKITQQTESGTRAFSRAIDDLERNVRAGNISWGEYAKRVQIARARMAEASAAANSMQGQMNRNSFALTNLSYQFQDFFVQIASGTDAMRALAQQAPQALGALGFSGRLAMFGSLAGTAVAIGTVLIPMLMKTGESAEESAKGLDNLGEAVSKYSELAENAIKTSGELVTEFGRFGEVRGEFSRLMAEFARADVLDQLEARITKFTEQFGGLSLDKLVFDDGVVMKQIESTWLSVREELKLTDDQTNAVVQSMYRLSNAANLEETIEASRQYAESMMDAFGSIEKMPASIRETVVEALRLGELSTDLAKDWDQIANDRSLHDMYEDLVDKANMNLELSNKTRAEEEKQANAFRESLGLIGEMSGAMMGLAVRGQESAESARLIGTASEAGLEATENWVQAAMALSGALEGAVGAAARAAKELGGLIAARNQMAGLGIGAIGGFGGDGMSAQRALMKDNGYSDIAIEQILNGGGPQLPDLNLNQFGLPEEGGMSAGSEGLFGTAAERAAAEEAWQAALDEQERAARRSARRSGRSGGGRGRAPKKSDEEKEAERNRKEMAREAERWMERIMTDTERLAEEQNELNKLYQEGYFGEKGSVEALSVYHRALRTVQEEYDPLTKATKEWVQSLKDGIVDSIVGTESLTDSFYSLGKAIEKALWQATLFGEGPFAQLFGGGGGILGGITDILGGVVANAKGNVYDSPSLSAYSNQIVSKPTLFAFAKGAGIMGEAGPEAIMPLSRGPDGRLGVKTDGGGASGQKIQLIVTAEEGELFVPRVRAIAEEKSVEVTRSAMSEMDEYLPSRVFGILEDDRVR